MSILKEFREFAMKGNVVDLAVGVIIGGAFGKIVTSLVTDVIMPPIGFILGGVNFKDLKIIIKEASIGANNTAVEAVSLNYGQFLQTVFDFLIIALAIFFMVKIMNKLKRTLDKEAKEKKTEEEALSKEVQLLSEIRDLLKK